MSLGRVHAMCGRLQAADSQKLTFFLGRCSREVQVKVLDLVRYLKDRIAEIWINKLSFHTELPWKLAGCLGENWGMLREAKVCAKECCSVADALFASGRERVLDR
eukprot:13067787-Alexandrium_andersonii.AAC.1